ncbi:MAG: hypothetical protein HDQ97_14895 [Lachnospiraceae bacterium]|nr:hypothetical protein [Lachnospiraceae bacterium]
MKVFNCILGVLAILGSVYCMFYPGLTFLNSGWIVAALLGARGICGISYFAANRNKPGKSKGEVVAGIIGLIMGIVAAVISVCALFMPGVRLMLDIIIICMFSGWLVVSGASSIAAAFQVKKLGIKTWILTLILGILVLLSGIYGIFHLIFMAQTIGILIGVLLMTYGCRLILTAFEKS